MKYTLWFFTLLCSVSMWGDEGETLYKAKCRVCHGIKADRPAYNASQIIAGWPIEKTIHALQGYKTGQYGGRFQATMEGIAKELSSEEMILLAHHVYKIAR